jgi:hypothetical protein
MKPTEYENPMAREQDEGNARKALRDGLELEDLQAKRKRQEEEQQQQQQRVAPHKKEVMIEGDDADAIKMMVDAYKKQFQDDGEYQEGYAEPVQGSDGRLSFSFPSDEKAVNFFSEQAKKNQPFILVNEDNQVLAYSDGKGTMCHANGDEFKKGEAFKPSEDPSLDQVKANMNSSSMQNT